MSEISLLYSLFFQSTSTEEILEKFTGSSPTKPGAFQAVDKDEQELQRLDLEGTGFNVLTNLIIIYLGTASLKTSKVDIRLDRSAEKRIGGWINGRR